jgi:hypothetical protein
VHSHPAPRSSRRAAFVATAAAALFIGVGVGAWMSSTDAWREVSAASDDARPGGPVGETRLRMDRSLEQFGRRTGTPERGKTSASSASPGPAPAVSTKPAASRGVESDDT